MADFDADKERENLALLTKEELIEKIIDLKINMDCMESGLREQADQAYESGGRKGYTEGFNDGRDEGHR
jgi:flagellar biosynthesis/type III secretory pathway protein FliH